MILCLSCGEKLPEAENVCSSCGHRSDFRISVSSKSRLVAAWLSILLGGVGAQWFYFGKPSKAFLFMLISPVAAVLGLIQGFGFLRMSDREFASFISELN